MVKIVILDNGCQEISLQGSLGIIITFYCLIGSYNITLLSKVIELYEFEWVFHA